MSKFKVGDKIRLLPEDDEYTFKVGDEVRWVDDDSGGDVDSETKFVIHSYGNNENYPYHVRLAGHTERYSPPTFTDACWSKDELELWVNRVNVREDEHEEYTFKVGDEVRCIDNDNGGLFDSITKFIVSKVVRYGDYPYVLRDECGKLPAGSNIGTMWSKDELELWEDIEEEDEDVIYPESEDKTLPSTKPDTHQYFPTAKQIKGYVKT